MDPRMSPNLPRREEVLFSGNENLVGSGSSFLRETRGVDSGPHRDSGEIVPMAHDRLDPWTPSSEEGDRDDRIHDRRPCRRYVWIINGAGQFVIRCKVDNVSESGLHATAPKSAKLAVGNRFEMRLASENGTGNSPSFAPSLGYATVIRTEPCNLEASRIGFAMRFDVPQLGLT